MNNADLPTGSDRAALSALMDGELDASQVAAACASWRSQAGQRADWHLYHLIGDALRSDDLATAPARDEQFMRRLRERLDHEPVVLAPSRADTPGSTQTPSEPPSLPLALPAVQPASATGTDARPLAGATAAPAAVTPLRARTPRRVRWAVPVSMAAGVVAVAGVVWTTRPDPGALMAGFRPAPQQAASAAALRDDRATLAEAELSHYLRAHREVPGLVAPNPTAGYLRNAAYDAGAR
jgi:sigma-E factor negative regulatory protein RseA